MRQSDAELIDIFLARGKGKDIQRRTHNSGGLGRFHARTENSWDTAVFEYRVKPEPKVLWATFDVNGKPWHVTDTKSGQHKEFDYILMTEKL